MAEKKLKGFAALRVRNPERMKELARNGGLAAHASGKAHQFNKDEAVEAGKKGGIATSRNRAHMSKIGRKGGLARAEKAAAAAAKL